jgi:hypothetical protein
MLEGQVLADEETPPPTDQAQAATPDQAPPEEAVTATDETTSEEPAPEETQPSGAYLADKDSEQGMLEILIRILENGEDAPFYQRYRDSFSGNPAYLDEFSVRSWQDDASVLRFDLWDSWDSSRHAAFDWRRLGETRFWGSYNRTDHFEMPDAMRGGRTDLVIGIGTDRLERNNVNATYAFRQHRMTMPGDTGVSTEWSSNEISAQYDFMLNDWAGSLRLRNLDLNQEEPGMLDVSHTSGAFTLGRSLCNRDFVLGSILYNLSDVDTDTSLRNLRLTGYGRFVNALGIEGLNVTGRVGWDNRTAGPSRLHPVGDGFDFKADARWTVSPEVRLRGSVALQREDTSYADDVAMLEYRSNPALREPIAGRIIGNTISTWKYNVGGRWSLSDTVDATADWTWVDRKGLDPTYLGSPVSPHLLWDSETRSLYSLRYAPATAGWGAPDGVLELKYETEDRSNDARLNSTDVERLSLDWSGMVQENVWAYLGGGLLKTGTMFPELSDYDQRGREFNCGIDWTLDDPWSLYGDFWNDKVTGADGFNQTSYKTGLEYDVNDFWSWCLEYERDKGSFVELKDLNYTVDLFALRISRHW